MNELYFEFNFEIIQHEQSLMKSLIGIKYDTYTGVFKENHIIQESVVDSIKKFLKKIFGSVIDFFKKVLDKVRSLLSNSNNKQKQLKDAENKIKKEANGDKSQKNVKYEYYVSGDNVSIIKDIENVIKNIQWLLENNLLQKGQEERIQRNIDQAIQNSSDEPLDDFLFNICKKLKIQVSTEKDNSGLKEKICSVIANKLSKRITKEGDPYIIGMDIIADSKELSDKVLDVLRNVVKISKDSVKFSEAIVKDIDNITSDDIDTSKIDLKKYTKVTQIRTMGIVALTDILLNVQKIIEYRFFDNMHLFM